MKEKDKKILEALKKAGYNVRLDAGSVISVISKEGMSEEEITRLIEIMINHDFRGRIPLPKVCIIVTDDKDRILQFSGNLLIFSNQEMFERFKEKFSIIKTKLYPHQKTWEEVVTSFSCLFSNAILDCEGDMNPATEPVYNLIPLMEYSEIGGTA